MQAIDINWWTFGLTVLFGAFAGGVTNTIAVWMLFHPYQRRYGFQGAIPKNKERLAKSIGRTVGERLLTPGDIVEELGRGGVRESFEARVQEMVGALLETERGSIQELLPPEVFAEVERTADELAPMVGTRLAAYVESPEFETMLLGFVERARAELEHRPIAADLTTERRAALRERATSWVDELSQSPELERSIRDYLDRHADDILASNAPLAERVPAPIVEALERAVTAYLPMAVEKLGNFLGQPAARERIREALHDVFGRFVEDLRFHERLIAKLVVTERTFEKALDAMERDGVEQLASLLDDPLVREEISVTITSAIDDYLHKPASELLGDNSGDRARALVGAVGDYLIKAIRAEGTRTFLVDRVDVVLSGADGRTWGELLRGFDDATVARWLTQGARSERVRELVEQAVRAAGSRALTRPIGKPGRWLPGDATPRLSAVIAPAMWTWMQAQLPTVIQRFDVEGMVERKVRTFSVQRMEEIIRNVTQKELDLIVRLGYVLGAFIGLMSFGFSTLLPVLIQALGGGGGVQGAP